MSLTHASSTGLSTGIVGNVRNQEWEGGALTDWGMTRLWTAILSSDRHEGRQAQPIRAAGSKQTTRAYSSVNRGGFREHGPILRAGKPAAAGYV